MARWLLKDSHYLNILDPDTGEHPQWEHKEQDRTTGKMARKMYTVPALLDVKDPSLFNDPDGIVVCHEGKGNRKDITFFGDPTPHMEPMDEEAEAITKALEPKWIHPIDTLPTNGGGGLSSEAMAMMEAFAKQVGGAVPNKAIPSQTEFDQMKSDLAELRALLASQQPSGQVPKTIDKRI